MVSLAQEAPQPTTTTAGQIHPVQVQFFHQFYNSLKGFLTHISFGLKAGGIIQLDGANDTSDDDDDDDDLRDDDNDPDDDEQNEDEAEGMGEEEVRSGQNDITIILLKSMVHHYLILKCCQEPLNSGDDVSDEDPSELFDTDNVIVCQYDKVRRLAI